MKNDTILCSLPESWRNVGSLRPQIETCVTRTDCTGFVHGPGLAHWCGDMSVCGDEALGSFALCLRRAPTWWSRLTVLPLALCGMFRERQRSDASGKVTPGCEHCAETGRRGCHLPLIQLSPKCRRLVHSTPVPLSVDTSRTEVPPSYLQTTLPRVLRVVAGDHRLQRTTWACLRRAQQAGTHAMERTFTAR